MNHNFKKKYGQNFLKDKNLLNAIIDDAGVNKNDEVLEIGAGAGSLTSQLNERAKKVISFEIDRDLQPILEGLNLSSTSFVFEDIMNASIEEIESRFENDYKIIANLPYYITTPIIFKFLTQSKRLTSLTIMVQKEVAQRIVASHGNKDYGILSIMCQFYGDAAITRIVNKKMFYPKPKIDSAVVNIKIDRQKNADIDDEKFYQFIKCIFSMRRKTIKNNLLNDDFFKEKINLIDENILSQRAEMLDKQSLLELYKKIL